MFSFSTVASKRTKSNTRVSLIVIGYFSLLREGLQAGNWASSDSATPIVDRFCQQPLQHGLLKTMVFVAGVGSAPPRVSTSYVPLCDNILHRMRFPKFLLAVREDLGEEVGVIIYSIHTCLGLN